MAGLAQDCGLLGPSPLCRAVLLDTHLFAAIWMAVPVWALLALSVGQRMQVPPGGWAWVSLVLVQPLAEEIVFRGVLHGQLLRLGAARRVGPLTAANWLTTAGFAALHLVSHAPAWALAVIAPSLVFGHLRERFQSVWPPVLVHALYNAGFGFTAWLVQGHAHT